ncbi:prenyltransferase [Lactobacillus terrae]|uniref:prenyltransferase n=1 Tax=Lactobacillus terrae TaxID=2269374 RepID=UPI000C1B6773|nr:prenyltransferase [Lactobacillus terrae]
MNRALFVELSEVKSTVLDVSWFVLAASFCYLQFGKFNFLTGILALIVVIFDHMFINFHNNYMDFKHSKDEFYRTKISTVGMSRGMLGTIRKWMYGLGLVVIILGLVLVYLTNWITLVLGIIGVGIGMLYSAGPKPINSTIFGETLVSIAISILIPVVYVILGLVNVGTLDSSTVINLIIFCLPNTFVVFSAQLCNNTCDLDEDVKNGRYTLPYKIGHDNAISLFKALWALAFLLVPILVILKVTPYTTLILILLYPNIWSTFKPYFREQVKTKTYPLVMKAISKFVLSYIGLIAIGAVIKIIFK